MCVYIEYFFYMKTQQKPFTSKLFFQKNKKQEELDTYFKFVKVNSVPDTDLDTNLNGNSFELFFFFGA